MTVSGKPFNFRWALFLSYAVFLYVTFTLPGDEIPPAISWVNDRLLHFLSFFLLALLAFRAFFYSRFQFFCSRAVDKAGALSLFYGGFLEWLQRTVPGRSSSLADFVFDAFGILCAYFLVHASQPKTPSRSPRAAGDN